MPGSRAAGRTARLHPTPAAPRRGRSGFTLIELLVVLAIAGLVLGLAMPKLLELSGVELKSAARRLAGAARYAANQAVVRKIPHRIRFHFEERTYRVEEAADDQWIPDRGSLGRPVQLPRSVRITLVETRARGRRTDGEAWIEFYPKGYAERAVVQLTGDDNRVYTIEIRPFDLRPRVHAEALDLREVDARAMPSAALSTGR